MCFRQLQDRVFGMQQSLSEEIKEKKKLKMDCVSLRFKLLDAHHKIEQLNAVNASEEDVSIDTSDSAYMSRLSSLLLAAPHLPAFCAVLVTD